MTIYQSSVGNLATPPDSLTLPEFLLDSSFLKPDSDDPAKPDWICLIDDSTGRQVRFSEVSHRDTIFWKSTHALHSCAPGQDASVLRCMHSEKSVNYPVCIWAAQRLGATVATMNPAMTATELAHQLKLSNPSVIFVKRESISLVEDAANHAGLTQYFTVVLDANGGSDLKHPTVESLIVYGKSLPPFSQPTLGLGEAKAKVAFLCFSSGTTGLPKAVCISHYNFISNILQMEAAGHVYDPQVNWEDKRYRPGGVISGVLPLYHVYGLVFSLHFILYARMTLMVTAKFNFEKMLDNISRYRITDLVIVPSQAVLLSKHPAVPKYDISSVRTCVIAAAPLSAEVTESLLRVLPDIHLGQGYGMTEATGGVAAFPLSPKIGVLGSAGKLFPGTTAKVVKTDGTLASAGERGELYIQGPQVALGYYKNTAATNEAFVDEWLCTGDEVYFDEDGHLFIVDRIKELIKVKGFQVAPAELEGHLLAHDDVADAAVIGVPDDFAGELPCAFIVLKTQIASKVKSDPQVRKHAQEILFKHVSTTKSSYKWLTGGIEFVDVIPKSPSGKISRRVLRDQAAAVPRLTAKTVNGPAADFQVVRPSCN
ncbi:phenylacetyl-CoA ligase [Mycena latifolia]|nr:phenylacetyl-CoA ligase [Mycena latifolia]